MCGAVHWHRITPPTWLGPIRHPIGVVSTGMSKVKNKFKTPEGRWALLSERTFGALPFNHHRSTRMTLARLPPAADQPSGGAEDVGPWLIYNIGEFVYIAKADSTRNVRGAPCGMRMVLQQPAMGARRWPPVCAAPSVAE